MLRFFLVFFLFIPVIITAQVDSLSLKYETLIDSSFLKNDLIVLSHDSLLGRETAQLGQKKADKYIKSRLIDFGIEPAINGDYFQYFNVVRNDLNTVALSFKDYVTRSQEDIYATSFINDSSFSIDEIIFIGHGISCTEYDNYENISVNDKLVFMYEEDPVDEEGNAIISSDEIKKWYNDDRAEFAKQQGASGVVFISKTFSQTKDYFKRAYKYRDLSLYQNTIAYPTFYINEELFFSVFDVDSKVVNQFLYKKTNKRIIDKFDFKKDLSFNIESNREVLQSSNVIGKLKSKNPDAPWIVLTAHYDHEGFNDSLVYNGADDNGSGTAAVLNIAKAFSESEKEGVEFENNILFMLVSGEEKGLLGSKYYVSNPIVPLEKTLCNLNMDMIGRFDTKHPGNDNYVYIIGSDRISKDLHDINEEMNSLYTHLEFDYTYNAIDDPNRYYQRSDHYNFAKKGIPVIFYYNGTHADYHKPSDTEEKIVYKALLRRTELVFHTAWFLAMMKNAHLN